MIEGSVPFPKEFAERYIRDGLWLPRTLGDVLESQAKTMPERIFLEDGDRRFTFAEVDDFSIRLAARLLEIGFRPLDIVLLQIPNMWEFLVAFFAMQKIGVLPVLCLPPHRNSELTCFAKLTGAKGYFCAPHFRNFDYIAMARDVQKAAPAMEHLVATGHGTETGVSYIAKLLECPVTQDERKVVAAHRPDPYEVAFFLLSGGTTGIPKLIPRTHADYIYNATENARMTGMNKDSVFMVIIPAAHNFPLGSPGMIGALLHGGKVAMCHGTDPDTVFAAIKKHCGTELAVSPALLIQLLNSPSKEKYELKTLRYICAGGQKMQPELVDRTWETWPHATPGHAFGMAEGLINLTSPSDSREVIRETQGRPVSPADEIKIVDENDREVPRGEVGELLTRGPYTIRGYYKAEEHNRTAFTADGFYRTGDMVRMHHSGNLVVEGRRKDLINRGGEKISAEEIENLILGHESVHMAAVVAMPDPVMGEKGCAFVIPKPNKSLTLRELTDFLLSKQIAKFKLPERLEIVDSFPLTGVGKISKKDLRAIVAQKLKDEGEIE